MRRGRNIAPAEFAERRVPTVVESFAHPNLSKVQRACTRSPFEELQAAITVESDEHVPIIRGDPVNSIIPNRLLADLLALVVEE